MTKVTVRHIFNGEIVQDYSDMGVFYPEHGIVISCDDNGLVEIYEASLIEGTDVVIVGEGANDLSSDNPELVINLISGGTK